MAVQFKNVIFLKLIAVGFLMFLFMIPTGMINGLINERASRSEQAINEVSSKWGNKQTIVGPILTVPYKKVVETEDKKIIETIKYIHFLPKTLSVNGDVNSEMLNRGIYEVVVYKTKLSFRGEFSQPDFAPYQINDSEIIWDDATVSIGIPDVRGISENININWDGNAINARPGLEPGLYIGQDTYAIFDPREGAPTKIPTSAAGSGSGVNIPAALNKDAAKKYTFSFDLNLNGSRELNFVPVAAENNVELASLWPSPSFVGAFLPDQREVNNDGFKAKWRVLEYNRSLPQSWLGDNTQDFMSSTFGVGLIVPVDEYQKNTRSIKYAIMLIALTFLIFFFAEAMNRIKVHPIQYILVGLAIVLFFTLLLSISEYLGFNSAFLISAFATIMMVTLYSSHIFKNKRLILLQGGILTLIYAFIFTIIQLEDYALLVGSIGLFIILAIVMFISRKINWYEMGSRNDKAV